MDTVSAFITLLLVMDPLGNVPIFLSVLKDVDSKRRQWVILREMLIALVILMIFLWGGQALLNLLGLRQESISIAGATGIAPTVASITPPASPRHPA